jgi:hypothetical protein
MMQFAERPVRPQSGGCGVWRDRLENTRSAGLDDPGFDASVFCEFRARLLAGSVEQQLLDATLALRRDRAGCVPTGVHNRMEAVRETVHHALNVWLSKRPNGCCSPFTLNGQSLPDGLSDLGTESLSRTSSPILIVPEDITNI